MGRRKIDAKDALESIRSGMDDHALMQKYEVSAKGLQSLFRKLVNAGSRSRRTLSHVERRNVMSQVDDTSMRACLENHRVAHADPCVISSEIGHEADD